MVGSSKFLGNTNHHQFLRSIQSRYTEKSGVENESEPKILTRVDSNGKLVLPDEYRKRWGLTADTELLAQETPEGLFLRPLDPPLKKVYVEPTSCCNLNCQTCVRNSWQEPTGFMNIKHYQGMLNNLKGVPSLEKIAFWGIGEPLLHPDIVGMVSSVKALGVETELITNALLLDKPLAEDLLVAGLDRLVVSVDSVSEHSYACIRSGGDLNTVMKNIQYLNTMRAKNEMLKPEIGIEFVAMKKNVSELPELRQLAFAMGASFIIVTNLLPYTEELNEEILYWLSAGNLFSPARSLQYPEVTLPRMDERDEYMQPARRLLQSDGMVSPFLRGSGSAVGHCRFVWEGTTSVSWDGGVSPCIPLMHSYTCYVLRKHKAIRRYSLGNVGEEGIINIWNSDEYRQFRQKIIRFEFSPCVDCGGCELAESNKEDCFGNTFPVCGDCLWARGVILCP